MVFKFWFVIAFVSILFGTTVIMAIIEYFWKRHLTKKSARERLAIRKELMQEELLAEMNRGYIGKPWTKEDIRC